MRFRLLFIITAIVGWGTPTFAQDHPSKTLSKPRRIKGVRELKVSGTFLSPGVTMSIRDLPHQNSNCRVDINVETDLPYGPEYVMDDDNGKRRNSLTKTDAKAYSK